MIETMACQAQVYGFLNKPNVNDVQYEKCCGQRFPEPSKISPAIEELHQHVKRVNYRAFVQKNALEANQEILEADQRSWDAINGACKVHGLDNETVPDAILQLVVCECKKGNCTEQYQYD